MDTNTPVPAESASSIVHPLPPMSAASVEAVRELENASLELLPQVKINTEHALHAGMYARTIMIPSGIVITGVQIKIPTILIVSGDALFYGDDGTTRLTGYHVTLGAVGRKQAICALADTYLTMMFATSASTVAEAEEEFTDEPERLGSRRYE
ncbi:hypothetical protein DSECCO2_25640 [anaerobic digester metagenome]